MKLAGGDWIFVGAGIMYIFFSLCLLLRNIIVKKRYYLILHKNVSFEGLSSCNKFIIN